MLPKSVAASFLTGLLVAALVLILPGRSLAAEGLSGSYYGIDDAAGASIEIHATSDGYRGTFFDRHGNSQSFDAQRVGAAAEAKLQMDGRTVLLRATPKPFGAEVMILPFDQEGNLAVTQGRLLNFVRGELGVPRPDPDFVQAPEDARGRITANSFLASYEFWTSRGVRNGYLSLPDRFRTLMRLFPAVQLDVIWKLCLAPQPERALALALRGQGVSCAEVTEGIAASQRTGSFDEFKAEVAQERATLRLAVRCADGYPESKPNCDRAARALSTQAVSLETAGTVLARYR